MKYIQNTTQYRKIIGGISALAVLMLLTLSANCFAQDYVSIKVYPEHVGVFTTVGTQQFVAFGVAANGSTTNITDMVSWESSDPNIVTIDDTGLATIVTGKTSGQVKITCSYPKASKGLNSVTQLLLGGGTVVPTYTVTSSVTGTGTIIPTPTVTVAENATTVFVITETDAGFTFQDVTGTCPAGAAATDQGGGIWSYTTGSIVADCTVIANFVPVGP